ncbi:hypothetical protein CJ030_MR0G007802 [Morella rubra]|uniref:Uncharacterized protein n=1 Tax=Morella rubra TaxID=262757 RepID=A0A6A1UJA2_9ROSI|nr:hypothetical protein CJ030_MR0G007802 [Morella rubra]
MEGYGDKESSTSPSRLSPFAQPFSPQPTLNSLANSSQQPFAPSLDGSQSSDPSSSLLGSFSDLTLEGDSEFNVPWDAYDYCGHLSDMALMDFPCDNPPDFNYDGQSYLCPKDSSLALEGNRMLAVSYDPDIAAALPSSKCLMPNYTQNLLGISNVSQRVDSGKVAQRVSSGDWLCNMEQDKKKDHERSFFWNEGSSACESLQKQGISFFLGQFHSNAYDWIFRFSF